MNYSKGFMGELLTKRKLSKAQIKLHRFHKVFRELQYESEVTGEIIFLITPKDTITFMSSWNEINAGFL